jgi:LysM repeat protein
MSTHKTHGTSVDQLVEWNDIADPDVIRKGQKLIVDKSDQYSSRRS